MASYFLVFPSFDSGAVGDHFRMAVGLAIKAREIDLSYAAVSLSDYAGISPVGGCCYFLLPATLVAIA